MPWSIPVPGNEQTDARDLFIDAIKQASEEKRLIFCSSPDKGKFTGYGYPSAVEYTDLFRIGAAYDYGTPYDYADDDVNYIFPGVKVNSYTTGDRRGQQDEMTGSDVATALAASLAATVMCCFKTAALATKIALASDDPQAALPSTQFKEEHIRSIAEHLNMEFAFNNIGFVTANRFVQVWDSLDPVSKVLDDPTRTHEDKVECIIKLCTILTNWRALGKL